MTKLKDDEMVDSKQSTRYTMGFDFKKAGEKKTIEQELDLNFLCLTKAEKKKKKKTNELEQADRYIEEWERQEAKVQEFINKAVKEQLNRENFKDEKFLKDFGEKLLKDSVALWSKMKMDFYELEQVRSRAFVEQEQRMTEKDLANNKEYQELLKKETELRTKKDSIDKNLEKQLKDIEAKKRLYDNYYFQEEMLKKPSRVVDGEKFAREYRGQLDMEEESKILEQKNTEKQFKKAEMDREDKQQQIKENNKGVLFKVDSGEYLKRVSGFQVDNAKRWIKNSINKYSGELEKQIEDKKEKLLEEKKEKKPFEKKKVDRGKTFAEFMRE